jgi:hypothetical protein
MAPPIPKLKNNLTSSIISSNYFLGLLGGLGGLGGLGFFII